MKRVLFVIAALWACAHNTPTERVELLPALATDASAGNALLDEANCEPEIIEIVDVDSRGELDAPRLRAALLEARDFAQRCCNGDEGGDATVQVTVAPEGFTTQVTIDPPNLASGATGSCLYASFHRLTTKGFHGDAVTVSVQVHVHR